MAGGEREGSPKQVGRRVLKTNFIVSRNTLSAQNCTKHIQEEMNYRYIRVQGQNIKLIHVPLKLQSTLGTLLGEKQNKPNERTREG